MFNTPLTRWMLPPNDAAAVPLTGPFIHRCANRTMRPTPSAPTIAGEYFLPCADSHAGHRKRDSYAPTKSGTARREYLTAKEVAEPHEPAVQAKTLYFAAHPKHAGYNLVATAGCHALNRAADWERQMRSKVAGAFGIARSPPQTAKRWPNYCHKPRNQKLGGRNTPEADA